MHAELTPDQLALFTYQRAELHPVPPPVDLSEQDRHVDAGARYPRSTPVARYVRARCLTAMRQESTSAAVARVALGGQLVGYQGSVPGIAEEILLTLDAGRPVYLLGGFGGAAHAVLDVLRGQDRPEFTSAWCRQNVTGWSELMGESRRRGEALLTPEELNGRLRAHGAHGLAGCLRNGLSEQENRVLTTALDARHAVELVLRGLQAGLRDSAGTD
jgi:hypothetical protein